MSKELPYFKFVPSEWLLGEIVMEPLNVQGLYINVCSFYWQKECKLNIATLNQRLSHPSEMQILIEKGFIKHEKATGDISIRFLDEQWSVLKSKHEKLSESGRKGGQASVKARLSLPQASVKPPSSIKKENKNKKENKIFFKDSIFFNNEKFKEALPGWPSEKLSYYYDSVLRWSEEGNKKINWISTVKNWAARDEAEGKLKFNKKAQATIQGII